MMNTLVRLYIIPSEINIASITFPQITSNGITEKSISNLDKLIVNQVGNDYLIVYRDSVFENIDVNMFAGELVKLLNDNLKGANISLTIQYWCFNGNLEKLFNPRCGSIIVALNKYLEYNYLENIKYLRSDSVSYILAYYDEYSMKFDFSDEDDEIDNEEYEDNDEEDDYDDEDEDEDDEDEYGTSFGISIEDSSPQYRPSRILRSVKNPRRSFKRHGLIVIKDKSLIKKDEKILKEFLKGYFPGKSKWIKEFRSEVLDRWMAMYSISRKDLNRIEKERRKKRKFNKKNYTSTKEKVMTMANKLFNNDTWNDPNR